MKVVQINCVFQNGSTGKIVYDIDQGLRKEGIDSYVLYGRGEIFHNDAYILKLCTEPYAKLNNALSRITGIMYGGCFFSTRAIIKKLEELNPDIVHIHCINGYFVNIYQLLKWLADRKINTVVTQHAEFFYTGGCGYAFDCNKWESQQGCGNCPRWKAETRSLFLDQTHLMWKKMQAAFAAFDNERLRIVSVSPWLDERTVKSAILGNRKHVTVLNGIDTKGIFHERKNSNLKQELAANGEKIILHVTPNFTTVAGHNKGGYYVLELARRMCNQPVKFVVIGSFEKVEAPKNMLFIGRVNDQKRLAEYYSSADVTLLTSRRETFSMVCAESLSCGTPIVGFMAGGPERIALPDYSTFVEYGDIEQLQKAVEKKLELEKNRNISSEAIRVYDQEKMVEEYIEIYKTMI